MAYPEAVCKASALLKGVKADFMFGHEECLHTIFFFKKLILLILKAKTWKANKSPNVEFLDFYYNEEWNTI